MPGPQVRPVATAWPALAYLRLTDEFLKDVVQMIRARWPHLPLESAIHGSSPSALDALGIQQVDNHGGHFSMLSITAVPLEDQPAQGVRDRKRTEAALDGLYDISHIYAPWIYEWPDRPWQQKSIVIAYECGALSSMSTRNTGAPSHAHYQSPRML
jgi:hypothetical protein